MEWQWCIQIGLQSYRIFCPPKTLPWIIDLIYIFACYQDQKTFQTINYLFSHDYILLWHELIKMCDFLSAIRYAHVERGKERGMNCFTSEKEYEKLKYESCICISNLYSLKHTTFTPGRGCVTNTNRWIQRVLENYLSILRCRTAKNFL